MFLLLGGRIIQVLLSVALIRLATTFLSPSEYGTWILIQTTAGLFILFGISPFGLYLNRHIIDWQKGGSLAEAFKGYTSYLILFSLLMTILTTALIHLKIVNFTDLSISSAAILVCLLMVAQTFHQTWIPTLNFLGDRKGFVVGSSAAIIITIVMSLLLNGLGVMSVSSWLICMAFGYIVSTLIFVPKAWFKKSGRGVFSFFKEISPSEVLSFSGPLFITTVFSWAQTQGYRLLVENKLGLPEFGKFAAGYAVIAGLFGSVENVISNFYQANFFQRINVGSNFIYSNELEKVWKVTLYPYLISGMLLYLTAPVLATIFLDSKFNGDLRWLSLVALSEGGRLIFNLLSINFHGKKKTHFLILPQVLAVVLSLGVLSNYHSLNFEVIVYALGAGYLFACLLLLVADLKTYLSSGLIKHVLFSGAAAIAFLLLGHLTGKYLDGIYFAVVIILFSGLFMLPYLIGHLRNKHG